ncbi:hypothetical protein BBJ28_00020449, partial [Nothophytophthora sp. Chile5]
KAAVHELQTLKLDEKGAKLIQFKEGLSGIRNMLAGLILDVYPSAPGRVAFEVAVTAAKQVKHALVGKDASYALYPELHEQLQFAFTELDYLGDAGDELAAYLKRCWLAYQGNEDAYEAPCVAVVQSSGFGKSRLLLQLAQETIKHDEWNMRVLYTCARFGKSTGYPAATVILRDWLFKRNQSEFVLRDRLVAAYHYAQENWATVGDEWLELFTHSEADETVQTKLEDAEAALQSKSAESTKKTSTDKATQESSQTPGRVLILAVDSARALLTQEHCNSNCIRLLRNALVRANKRIRKSQRAGGIFAVLVDMNPKVSGPMPPLRSWSSAGNEKTLFPPFVLTHTMDVYWRHRVALAKVDEVTAYKALVTQDNEEEAWNALVSMGRPMWASTVQTHITKHQYKDQCHDVALISEAAKCVVNLAGNKLLVGCSPHIATNFNEKTMFGVASMLCRLGLRPRSTLALASWVVAEFMATLAYVSHENDRHLCVYASDPVLAMGATRVWYALPSALPKFILPQFETLLLNEMLDVGDVAEVVARIVLLLVMDTCVVVKTGIGSHSGCRFRGQFVSVRSFMEALGGAQPPVMTSKQTPASDETEEASAATVEALKAWQSQWEQWQLGFCHFVQLDIEPTEETLWFLLGRRAAGVLPRDQEGADLVIPMNCGTEVSMILIQAKNVEDHYSEFPQSATEEMYPSFVFAAENKLSAKSPRDVIRVHMSLGGPVPKSNPDRFVLAELSSAAESPTPVYTADLSAEAESMRTAASQLSSDAFTLCIRSVGPWELVTEKVTHPVVSEAVAAKLKDLVSSRWDPMGLVESDLRDRHAVEERSSRGRLLSKVMPDDELVEAASRAQIRAPAFSRKGEGDDGSVALEEKPAVPMNSADATASSD